MTILERMRTEDGFTDTEKKIIRYILADPYSLLKGSIGRKRSMRFMWRSRISSILSIAKGPWKAVIM